MKRVSVFLVVVSILLIIAAFSFYPKYGVIRAVEYDNDLVVIEDDTGDVWIYGDTQNVICGSSVTMLIFNSFTPYDIHDDRIIQIR